MPPQPFVHAPHKPALATREVLAEKQSRPLVEPQSRDSAAMGGAHGGGRSESCLGAMLERVQCEQIALGALGERVQVLDLVERGTVVALQ